ncbi:MAG: hypothetical protein IT581_17485 [Verrucomicrobiales bacterium]|nr:hypothetical protein [Verrucomicrobiales bacterium]
MIASRKFMALAGVVLGLIGLLCVGTAVASAAFSIGDVREFVSRIPGLALVAGLGVALILLGGLVLGPGRLRSFVRCLRRDPALVILNHSPWSVLGEVSASDDYPANRPGLSRPRSGGRRHSHRPDTTCAGRRESSRETQPATFR